MKIKKALSPFYQKNILTENECKTQGVFHSFYIKNIFYDKMDLRLFYSHVTKYAPAKRTFGTMFLRLLQLLCFFKWLGVQVNLKIFLLVEYNLIVRKYKYYYDENKIQKSIFTLQLGSRIALGGGCAPFYGGGGWIPFSDKLPAILLNFN